MRTTPPLALLLVVAAGCANLPVAPPATEDPIVTDTLQVRSRAERLAHDDPAGGATDSRTRNPCDPATNADCSPPPGVTGYSIGTIMRFKVHRDQPT
jgi:hypothetical protein